jgi:GNAT superfamily N-acetyltransferase
MVYITESKRKILKSLSEYLLDTLVFAELGEPLLMRDGDVFGFYESDESSDVKGFFCLNVKSGKAFLRYVYVRPDERGKGIFRELLEKVEEICKESEVKTLEAVSTNSGLPLYLKSGFETKKSYVNYHKIQKRYELV